MISGSAEAVTDVQTVATEAFYLLDTGRQVAPFSSRLPCFDLDGAYRVTAAVRQMREARGETPLGRKIGFTNRTIWDEYQIDAPIWGYVYDRTVHDLEDAGAAGSGRYAGAGGSCRYHTRARETMTMRPRRGGAEENER